MKFLVGASIADGAGSFREGKMGLQLRPALAPALEISASAMDASFDESWVTLAQKLWLTGTSVRKVNPEIIKTDIWDQLDAEHFPARSLTTLESLQILEKYLFLCYRLCILGADRDQISVA